MYITIPNRDGTGPAGKGPLTGRGLGGCAPRKKKRNKWDELVWQKEHETIIMEGPNKTNCWWRRGTRKKRRK